MPAFNEKKAKFFSYYQEKFIDMLTNTVDPKLVWKRDAWRYEDDQGGGLTCIVENHPIIEKAAVNFSHIHGHKMPSAASENRKNLQDASFSATGVSIIVHPHNPFVPTVHANFRFFEAYPKNSATVWWFGGGYDLTPYYPFQADSQLWHDNARLTCQPFSENLYHQLKQQCDEYFYLKHRQEPRGIGGIFFDDLNQWPIEQCMSFIEQHADNFLITYQKILALRMHTKFSETHKAFQQYRRGRYVEFNLLYDRGTKFGLASQGRTSSILASLPPIVHWPYQNEKVHQLAEQKLLDHLKQWSSNYTKR